MGSCERTVPWPWQAVEASRVDARGLAQLIDISGGRLVGSLLGAARPREARPSERWLALPDSLCLAAPHDDESRGEPDLHSGPDIDLRFVGRHIAFVFCNLTLR